MTKTTFYLSLGIFALFFSGFFYFLFKSRKENAQNEQLKKHNQQLELEKQQLLRQKAERIKPKVVEPMGYR